MQRGVLLVDGDDVSRAATEQSLRAADYHVTSESSGEAAFDSLRTGYLPHLVLLAWASVDGDAFLESIRSHPFLAHLPVIVLADERPLDVGWLAYAPRPKDSDELLSMVQRYAR